MKSKAPKNQPQPTNTNNAKATMWTGCLVLNIIDNLTNNSTIQPTKGIIKVGLGNYKGHNSAKVNNIVKMIYGYISRNRNKL